MTETGLAAGRNDGCANLAQGDASCNNGGLLNARKLGIKEAATMMGIGSTSVRRLIHDGKIPVLKIGGKVMLLEQDIERFLQGCHVTLEEQNVRTPRAKALPADVVNSPHLAEVHHE